MSSFSSNRSLNELGSNKGKKITHRGNLIEMPSDSSFQKSSQSSKGRNSLTSSGFQPGRNNLDGPSSSSANSIARKNTLQRESSFSFTTPSKPSLSSLSAGVPVKSGDHMNINRMGLELKNPSSSSKRKIEDQPQHRNANARFEEGEEKSRDTKRFQRNTRSFARQNGAPIEIHDSDSEEEEDENERPGPSRSSPLQHIGKALPTNETIESSSLSSPESNTTLENDEKGELSRSDQQQEEREPHEISSKRNVNDKVQGGMIPDKVSISPPLDQRQIEKQGTNFRLYERHPVTDFNGKTFSIAKATDSNKLNSAKLSDRMKGRDGQAAPAKKPTQSFLPSGPSKYSSLYKSSLNENAKMSTIDDRIRIESNKNEQNQIKIINLQRLAFLRSGSPLGYIGLENQPIAEVHPLDTLIIKPYSGSDEEIVLNINELKNIHATLPSASTGVGGIYRILSIDIDPKTETFNKVATFLEGIKGAMTVAKEPIQIILDVARTVDTELDTQWYNFREKVRDLFRFALKEFSKAQIETAERSMQELPNLLMVEKKESPNSLVADTGNFTKTRPKARPSVTTVKSLSAVREKREGETKQSPTQVESGVNPSKKRSSSPKKNYSHTRLIYPTYGAGCVEVLQSDLEKLDEEQFLNDTIIDFGLKYLLEQIKERDPELHSQIFVFSSFFYNRFNERKNDRLAGYQSIKRWTKNTDIFKKKYIVVPINENLHWYLAIICNPFFSLPEEYKDSENGRKTEEVQGAQENGTSTDFPAVPSPESGPEGLDEREGDVTNDSLFDEGTPLHQSKLGLDVDGDSHMPDSGSPLSFAVEDKRTKVQSEQEPEGGSSDAIFNRGNGKILGGGDVYKSSKRKEASPIAIFAGDSFRLPESKEQVDGDDVSIAQVKRGRSNIATRSSTRIHSLSPENSKRETPKRSPGISTSNFYSSSNRLGTDSPQTSRQLRSHGSASVLGYMDLDNSRRSSVSSQDTVSEKWKKLLIESSTICIFDSLQQKHTTVRTAMRHYLALEFSDKRGIHPPLPPTDIDLTLIEVAMVRQPNYCDCGLYLLHAFERFFSDPEKFKIEVIPSRDSKHPAWNAKEALNLRNFWKERIERLSEEWQTERERRLEERKKEGKKDQDDEEEEEEEEEEVGEVKE